MTKSTNSKKGSKDMKKFTKQQVINMGAELFDEKGFTREQIRMWLTILVNNGWTEDFDTERIFDLIVG